MYDRTRTYIYENPPSHCVSSHRVQTLSSDASLRPASLKLLYQLYRLARNRTAQPPRGEARARVLLAKKRVSQGIHRERPPPGPKTNIGRSRGARGADRISHELMELPRLEPREMEVGPTLSTSAHLCQVEHHPGEAELSHASALPLPVPLVSLAPLSSALISPNASPRPFFHERASFSLPPCSRSFLPSRSRWYALRFAARGGAPLPPPLSPPLTSFCSSSHRAHAGTDVTTARTADSLKGVSHP